MIFYVTHTSTTKYLVSQIYLGSLLPNRTMGSSLGGTTVIPNSETRMASMLVLLMAVN